MFVDLRERELLAQPVSLPLVRILVDRFRVNKRIVEPVQLLCKVIDEKKADGGYVITAGEVSQEAAALAAAHKIQFVRGPSLLAMLEKAKETITTGVPAHFQWTSARPSSPSETG